MTHLRLAVVLVLTAAPEAAPQQVPTFATGVENVYVDVWVGHGAAPVEGLAASDFEVRDNGVPQRIELVDTEHVPLHTVLVVDTSASVAGRPLEALKAASGDFLKGLAPHDRATLVTFSHARRLRGSLAGEPAAAIAALGTLSASGATALRDAVFTGLGLVDPRKGRSAVVIFSDGVDRVSWLSAETVEAVARESEATVYVVDSAGRGDKAPVSESAGSFNPGPGGVFGSRRPAASGEGRGRLDASVFVPHETIPFLRHLAEETGGQVFEAGSVEGLGESFRGVLARIKSRYLLRYEPTSVEAGGWHKLEVRLKGKRGDVRARRGYLAIGAQAPS
jgi:VWFA-related protein